MIKELAKKYVKKMNKEERKAFAVRTNVKGGYCE